MRAFHAMWLVVLLAGCEDSSGPRAVRFNEPVVQRTPAGLEQRVVVVYPSTVPIDGPAIDLVSTIYNRTATPLPVSARVCTFLPADIGGTLGLEPVSFVDCAAIAMQTTLAPGDSIGPLREAFRVTSPAGLYALTVRHIVGPEFRWSATLRVDFTLID